MIKFSMIYAVSNNGVIGINNELPWHIPDDLRFFKETTKDSVVIMGRKTWDSLGRRTLPNRVNIVISSKPWEDLIEGSNTPGMIRLASLDDALSYAEYLQREKVFVIGGSSLFKEALPKVNEVFRTLVDMELPIGDNSTVFDCDLEAESLTKTIISKTDATDKNPGFQFEHWTR